MRLKKQVPLRVWICNGCSSSSISTSNLLHNVYWLLPIADVSSALQVPLLMLKALLVSKYKNEGAT